MIGALTSAAFAGPDDGDSVFSGSQIARNASENNDLAFYLDNSGNRFGHITGYFQDADGQWYKYDQGPASSLSGGSAIQNAYSLLNLGVSEGINITTIKDLNAGNILRNDDSFVYIETTKEQDKQISDQAFWNKGTMNQRQYRLWTNNCLTSFQGVCAAGGVQMPDISTSRPDKFFKSLKEMYPQH
jgi:hypothetical protein